MKARHAADLGVIGGSGLYSLLTDVEEVAVDTPYGATSAPITIGEVAGLSIAFLPRHGLGHSLPPHMVPYRANIWALGQLGVAAIYAPCASGSLQPDIHPGEFVIVDQLVDHTWGRASTFFDGPALSDGTAAPAGFDRVNHVGFGDPYDAELRAAAIKACDDEGVVVHRAGTVVVINGARFSTRAESRWYRDQGWHVINMTQMPEAVLARELEIPYAAIALITDYDVGLEGTAGIEAATMQEIFAMLERNAERVRGVLVRAVERLPQTLRA
jgi:5'-methylthioadenosine phosphorylase